VKYFQFPPSSQLATFCHSASAIALSATFVEAEAGCEVDIKLKNNTIEINAFFNKILQS